MDAHRINSGRAFPFLSRYPAGLIARLPPGLIVDVGAATGDKTVLMRKANPACRVIAYEPFPGNLPYLDRAAGGDAMVAIRPAAVSDYRGTGTLFLPSIIAGRDRHWAAMAGASRVGKLDAFPLRRFAAKVGVPVVTLDDEIGEHVRFLKIDVQRGEFHVLNGARAVIERHGVDLIYAEFRGDVRLLRLLDRLGYVFFDAVYMAWPHRRNPRNWFRAKADWRIPDWDVLDSFALSTGHRARHVWPRVPSRAFLPYCAWFQFERLFVTGLQTDLLCVHQGFLDEFRRLTEARGQP